MKLGANASIWKSGIICRGVLHSVTKGLGFTKQHLPTPRGDGSGRALAFSSSWARPYVPTVLPHPPTSATAGQDAISPGLNGSIKHRRYRKWSSEQWNQNFPPPILQSSLEVRHQLRVMRWQKAALFLLDRSTERPRFPLCCSLMEN